jgi:hypothetical protein
MYQHGPDRECCNAPQQFDDRENALQGVVAQREAGDEQRRRHRAADAESD